MNRIVSPHRGNRSAKSNRQTARAPREKRAVAQLDRGARIPTREMKQQMFMLGAMLRMPAGALSAHDDTPALRESLQKRLEYYKGLLAARDELAAGQIDGSELARRTEALTRAHYAT